MNTDLGDAYTRRDFLKTAAAGAILVGTGIGTGTGLAACGSSSSSSSTAAPASSPKRGGALRVGVTGGGTGDFIDAGMLVTNTDGLRLYQLYDSLYAFDKNSLPQLSLAEEVTHNADATEWTVRLRSGIAFHDGKDLTADDVIFTFQRILDPELAMLGANFIKTMDMANVKKLDPLTVRIPFQAPFAMFPECMATYFYFIVPEGYNPKNPVGTGPFKFKSFTAGQQSVFTRNENYWQSGLPYVDEVTISNYVDETSQLNALNSGELDIIDALSASAIPTVEASGGTVLVEDGQAFNPFTIRIDKPPFNDIRVRQAFRLVIDRPKMRELVFAGHGALGNDLFGLYEPTYNDSLPQRTVDVEKARSLLKQAGLENLTVTLMTAEIAAGSVKAAQIFAEQASAAGVTVKLKQVPVSELFGPNYKQWTFAQDMWNYNPYLFNAQNATLPDGLFNECHVDYPPYTKLWQQLSATIDPKLRVEIAHEMQSLEYEGFASGFMIPYFVPSINGMAKNVQGLTASKTGNPVGGFDLQSVWLA